MTDFTPATAEAIALLTQSVAGEGPVIDDEHVEGLLTVCGSLLALLEFHAGIRPEQALQDLGRMVASAYDVRIGSSATM